MKISVTEALRLKKEMAALVSKWQRDTGNIQFGITTQNGVVVSGTNDLTKKLGDYIESLEKLFKYSHELNSVLAKFDVKSGISDLVREKNNVEYMITMLGQFVARCSKTERDVLTERNVLLGQPFVVKEVFTPFMAKSEIKDLIKKYNLRKRQILSEIDAKNAEFIELPFEQVDLDEFLT